MKDVAHRYNSISGLEFELVAYGQHEDLVLIVLLPFVAHTSSFDGLFLDNVGKTASVTCFE